MVVQSVTVHLAGYPLWRFFDISQHMVQSMPQTAACDYPAVRRWPPAQIEDPTVISASSTAAFARMESR